MTATVAPAEQRPQLPGHVEVYRDDQSLSLQDNVRGVATSYFPASYVRAYGLALQ